MEQHRPAHRLPRPHLSHLRVDVGDTGLRLQAICDAPGQQRGHHLRAGLRHRRVHIGTPPVLPAATDFYVDKTMLGLLATPGTGTPRAPFCTITKGVSRLQRRQRPSTSATAPTPRPSSRPRPARRRTRSRSPAGPAADPVIGTGRDQRGLHLGAQLHHASPTCTFDRGTVGDGIYVTKSDHITVTRQHGDQRRAAGAGSHRPGHQHPRPNSSLDLGEQHRPQQRHRHLRDEHLAPATP